MPRAMSTRRSSAPGCHSMSEFATTIHGVVAPDAPRFAAAGGLVVDNSSAWRKDPDVPRAHAMRLAQHILLDPVTVTLIPDGDHRLSRPEDLKLLEAAISRAIEDAVPAQQDLFGTE